MTQPSATPIECALQQLGPVTLTQVGTSEERTQGWRSLVEQRHYLGHRELHCAMYNGTFEQVFEKYRLANLVILGTNR